MTTKKQRAELEEALSGWIFDGIANEWTTVEILSAVSEDWRKIVGAYTPSALREFAEWQGKVLELVGVGTNLEVARKQREADAGLLLWSSSEIPEHSVVGALVRELAEEILTGSASSRGADGGDVQRLVTPETTSVYLPVS